MSRWSQVGGSRAPRIALALVGTLLAALSLAGLSVAGPASARAHHGYRLLTFSDLGHSGMGARITGPDDANSLLPGTPKGFRKYVGAEGLAAATDSMTCDSPDAAVYVVAYTTNHFAAGAGSPCGGRWGNARVIVGKPHHHWKVLIATQDAWDCRLLRHYAVPGRLIKVAPAPADATHNCYDYTAHRPGNYHHR